MKYGVCLPTFRYGAEPTREHILAIAQHAEAIGFDSVWAGDHVLVPATAERMRFFSDPFVTLAYLASVTERLSLGTSVAISTIRNPVVMAKQCATLDFLSNGRLVVGLGAGWLKDEFNFVGVPHDRIGERFDEAIKVMRTLWTECPASFSGKFHSFDDAVLEPRPWQENGPLIWVGGGSKAAIRRAARLGDAWHSDDTPASAIREVKAEIDRLARELGRSVDVTTRVTVDVKTPKKDSTQDRGAGYYRGVNDWSGIVASGATLRQEVLEFADAGSSHFVAQFSHKTVTEHLRAMDHFMEAMK